MIHTDIEVHGPDRDDMRLVLGTIGWDDEGDSFDLGSTGGPTYAMVTLFRGRDFTKPIKSGVGQGLRTVARISSNIMNLPPRGTEVLVAFPDGHSNDPGAAIIIAAVSRVDGTAAYGNLKEGELCIHPDNADAKSKVLFKRNGTVSIFTVAASDGSSMCILLNSADGSASIVTPHGCFNIDASGALILAGQSGIKLGNDGTINVNCKVFTVNGNQVVLNAGTTLIGTGAVATPANSVTHGPSGIAAIASSQVFVGV